jgi:pimeloyl-ACP methyl ester carboxylesterase
VCLNGIELASARLWVDRTMLYLFRLATKIWLLLVGGKRKRLRVGPISLVYYQLGPRDGEPWLFLHGLGSVAATWKPLLRALRGSCRMIVPELSELGGSCIPGGGLGIRNGVDVIARLLEEELSGQPVTVAGTSLGGWLAVRLALRRPDLVSRLVLIDAGGYRSQDWEAIEALVRVHDLQGVCRLYGCLFVRVPWVMRLSRRSFFVAYTSRAVTGVLDDITKEDTFDDSDLRRLAMATALIWGEKDGLFKLESARAMLASLPNASLEVLPNCGHAVHLECPYRLAAAVQRFRSTTSPRVSATLPSSSAV